MTATPDWKAIGRQIRKGRRAAGLSGRAAAALAGMSPTYWQDIERGHRLDGGRINPSDRKLVAAARVARIDPVDLFARAGRTFDPKVLPAEEPAKEPTETDMSQVYADVARIAREAALEALKQSAPLPAALAGKISRLSEEELRAIERQVDDMLGPK